MSGRPFRCPAWRQAGLLPPKIRSPKPAIYLRHDAKQLYFASKGFGGEAPKFLSPSALPIAIGRGGG